MDPHEASRYGRNKNIHLEPVGRGSLWSRIRRRAAALMGGTDTRAVTPVITERIVEYPLIYRYLGDEPLRILDFGPVEDLLPLHLCALGHRVTGLDIRPYPFTHPSFDYIQEDILSWEPPDAAFDAVVSVSTIEHVGLAYYGDPVAEDGDRIAVRKLMRALVPGGRLLMTLPAGPVRIERGMRTYDQEAIRELVPGIETLRFFAKEDRYGSWSEVGAERIAGLPYGEFAQTVPSLGVAFVVAQKPDQE